MTAAKEALTHTRVLADGKQLQLREREQRIKDLQVKLNTCNSNREYQALKEQIAADEQANSVLSDEILEALEKIDVLQAEVAKTQADRNQAAEGLQSMRTETEGKQERLEAELRRVTQELADAEQPCRRISGPSTTGSREPAAKTRSPKSTAKSAAAATTC